ncbi:hypothetical protein C8034_v000463 [Colletotrichum sidae]|uniref:Uncharacterized protein n=1 Tax=Colletotrichum sidae TaxID=1347389 RepID=A0A4R8TGV1_9PEZI|nr:hypothetical protein C8034_v000463 [Colletotrichum sidae]
MPRVFPKSFSDVTAAKKSTSSVSTRQPTTPRRKTTPKSRNESEKPSVRSTGSIAERSPSSPTPPPQPIPETLMIDGLDNDDKYRMVEDEFFTVAGHFTAHLHAAEYQRLTARTRSHNAETIRNISRPVVGSLTELARRRQEEVLRKKKQREAIRRSKKDVDNDDASGDETAMPWQGTSLQGLMSSPQKPKVPLMTLTKGEAGARRLFGGPVRRNDVLREQDEMEYDSDDLDAPVRPARKKTGQIAERPLGRPLPPAPSRSAPHKARPTGSTAHVAASKPSTTPRASSTASSMGTGSSRSVTPNTEANATDDVDDDDEEDIFKRFKKRRADGRDRPLRPERKKIKKETKEPPRDIIPTCFL